MRESVLRPWTGAFLQFGIGALLATLLVTLASCSTGPGIISDTSEPRGKTVPPVVFGAIEGVPAPKLADLKTALALAGGQRDIGFVDGALQSSGLSMSGRLQAMVDNVGVRVFYDWEVRDGAGTVVHTLNGEENAGLVTGADPWAAVTSSVLDRIARATAQSVANRLAQMGYATRLSKLYVPPADYFAMAGPDAQRDIDFETLNGPGMAAAGLDMIAPQDPAFAMAPADPIPGESEVASRQPSAPEPEPSEIAVAAPPEPSAPVKTAEGKTEIRAVAVMQVEGSPGQGDAELTAAMRRTLTAAGWPVVSKPRPDAITIVGHVNVADSGPEQAVSVRWEVKSPDGKKLGDVKQANRVPAGALDRGWGEAAFAVAEAAAMGIFDIVKRVQ
ncbi:MAG TPA: hypothetical protein P5337_11805 [Aestuariivirga sp.]|nr:hypothetical protein [Aestuariivirga sp.]